MRLLNSYVIYQFGGIWAQLTAIILFFNIYIGKVYDVYMRTLVNPVYTIHIFIKCQRKGYPPRLYNTLL